jgi:endonuclease III
MQPTGTPIDAVTHLQPVMIAHRIQHIIGDLGLSHTKSQRIVRLAQQLVTDSWTSPLELAGVGHYGTDAYLMFCQPAWQWCNPTDSKVCRALALTYAVC